MLLGGLIHPDLFVLLRGFFSLLPPRKMSFPTHLSPLSIHAFFRDLILTNPHFQKYPPSAQYQKTFWKWAIHHLENMEYEEDFEIDLYIYEHYLSLIPSSGFDFGSAQPGMRQTPPSPSYVTYFWQPSANAKHNGLDGITSPQLADLSLYETVTLLESRTTIESGTTGLRTWLASLILSQHLINCPGLVKDKRVLELGSGSGFLGTIVARLQQLLSSEPPDLWLTDISEEVLDRCRANIQMPCNPSFSGSNIKYRFLDWSDSLDLEKSASLTALLQDEINADLILGADLIFDPMLISPLVGTLKLALQAMRMNPPKIALIAVPVRNEATIAQFLSTAKQEELHVLEVLEIDATLITFTQIADNNASNVKIFKIILY